VASWQVHDAKARFSLLLRRALKKGPQIITHRGAEAAVLVPIEEWKRLQRSARPSVREVLLGPGPRFENLVPDRGKLRRRKPVKFD